MTKDFMHFILGIFIILFLSSCNGGGGSQESTEEASGESSDTSFFIQGIVVDGYIQGAKVCLDTNINGECDENEPWSISNEEGEFKINRQLVSENSHEIIPIIALGGTDTATQKPFLGELKSIVNLRPTQNSQNPEESQELIINPLTDILTESFITDPYKDEITISELQNQITSSLGIEESLIKADPMKNSKVFAKAQEVQHIKKIIFRAFLKAKNDLSDDQQKIIKRVISMALMDEIGSSAQNNTPLNIINIINMVTTNISSSLNLNIEIPTAIKVFVMNQIEQIKNRLDHVHDSSDTTHLHHIQTGLDLEVEEAYSSIQNHTDGEIPLVPISNVDSLIEQGTAQHENSNNDSTESSDDSNEQSPSLGNDASSDQANSENENSDQSSSTQISIQLDNDFLTLNKVITLNGSQLTSTSSQDLNYEWSLLSKPSGSHGSFLTEVNIPSPRFSFDLTGNYTFRLTVSNDLETTSDTMTITYQKAVEYTHPIAPESIYLTSSHLTNGLFSLISSDQSHFYDTSYYQGLRTKKLNKNGIGTEKIDISSQGRSIDINDFSTSNRIYRQCVNESICATGRQHKTNKDKVYLEKLNFIEKSASEHIITSTNNNEHYTSKSSWNMYSRNNNFYLFRNLVYSQDGKNLEDLELIKLDPQMNVVWSKVFLIGKYGAEGEIVKNISWSLSHPYKTIEYLHGKLFIQSHVTGSRNRPEYLIVDDNDGSIEETMRFRLKDDSLRDLTFQNVSLSSQKNGKIYFLGYYNSLSGTQASSLNGVTYFSLDSQLNPINTNIVYSTDSELSFFAQTVDANKDAFVLRMISNSTGRPLGSKSGVLYFSENQVNQVLVFHDIKESHWGKSDVLSFNNGDFLLGNDQVSPLYENYLNIRTHDYMAMDALNKRFISTKFLEQDIASSLIEIDNEGKHSGCFEASNNNSSHSISFHTKSLRVEKENFTSPGTSSRNINILSRPREVLVDQIEERSPWLCSSYAINLDKTIRVHAASSVYSHQDSEKIYTYKLLIPPTQGTVDISGNILQPPEDFLSTDPEREVKYDLSVIGHKTVKYTAYPNASGNDSYTLRAFDGTGFKDILVTVEIK